MFRLQSNFKDFYDEQSDINSPLLYERNINVGMGRGEALTYLRRHGVSTVNFGPFRKFYTTMHDKNKCAQKFVVYTNPQMHDFKSKHIYTYHEVDVQYGNCIVSEFIESYGGYTVKYLQIGERRFKLMFKNDNFRNKLVEGELSSIEELPKQYNYAIGIPIYSIDYISDGHNMLAIDFNEVQRLDKIGMDKIITPEEVALEIRNALIAYNKA